MRKWIVIGTLIFLALLATDAVPALRGGWGWRWPYEQPDRLNAVMLLIGVALVYVIGIWLMRRSELWAWGHVVWGIVGGFAIALAVQNVREDPFFLLFSHTVSPVQTGASTVSSRFLAEEGTHVALNRWPEIMRESQALTITHFTTSPPGKALIHYWLAQTTEPLTPLSKPMSIALRDYQCSTLTVMEYDRGQMVSAGVGMLMPLWAVMAIIPIFVVAQQLGAQPQQAAQVAIWWPVVPSLLLFAPTWNTLYPLFAVSALALLINGLQTGRMRWIVGAGLLTSGMTFLNFAVLPLLGLYGFFTLLYWYYFVRSTYSIWWLVKVGFYFGGGLSMVWLGFLFYTGLTPFDLLAVTFDTHLDIERNYWVWLVLHVYDMLMFAGWPLVTVGAWGLWHMVRRVRNPDEPMRLQDVLVFALILTVIVLDVSGITRAESARIWLFFVPFILLSGTELFTTYTKNWDMPLLAVQLVTVVVMGGYLPVVAFDMNPPVEGPRTDIATLGGGRLAVDAAFDSQGYDGQFALQAYQFVADPAAQAITIELEWHGNVPTERPYQFELIAYAENELDGEIVSDPFYWYPQNGNYLTSCWQRGDQVREVVTMPLPPVSMPVQWTLQLRALHPDDIPTVHGVDTAAGVVVLGPIPYP